ncbi:MAG: hypothetical protein ACXVFZ_12850 [Blastococcus sp.]
MQTLVRWTGGCWVAAGVLTLAELAHPDVLTIGFAVGSRQALWPAVHVAWVLVALLMLFGLAGVAARFGTALGRLGAAGFVLAGIGLVVAAGLFLAEALLFPVVAREAPALLGFHGALGGSRALWAAGGLAGLWFVGLVLVGVAVDRAHLLPRRAGMLLAAATALFALCEGPFVPVLGKVSVVLLAAAQVWFGLAFAGAFAAHADRGGALPTMSAGERTPR